MNFARHGTFYLRHGWIRKALNLIGKMKKNTIFSPANIGEAIDELGIGKVMVISLRYWLDVLDVAKEEKRKNEINFFLTDFGNMILKYDEYLERKGTLWLLHYKMATAAEKATTWYWFFNEFQYQEFSEADFIFELSNYIRKSELKEIAESTLKKDFLCLKNTYLYEDVLKGGTDIEEAISCPLRELKLITQINGTRVLKRNRININELSAEIFYYTIIEKLDGSIKQVSIEEIAYEKNMPGKVFNLTLNQIYELLHVLDKRGYIKLNKKFGHNHIEIIQRDKDMVLQSYYSNHYLD